MPSGEKKKREHAMRLELHECGLNRAARGQRQRLIRWAIVGLGWLALAGSAAHRLAAQPAADETQVVAGDTQPAAGDTQAARPTPLDGESVLPWNRGGPDRARLPVGQLGGPRELMQLYGVDDSQLRSLFDGQPLGADEEEALVRILYRLPNVGLDSVDRWVRPWSSGGELAADPEPQRVQFFRIQGRVRQVERREILPELSELFEFPAYYRVRIEVPGDPHPLLVCARQVPPAWPLDESLDEAAAVDGLFLKVGASTSEGGASADRPAELVFAADRIAWLPDRPRPEWGVTDHHVLLARLGMDVSRLDDVRQRNRKPIGKEDRESFYQMLAASGRMTPELAADVRPDTLDLAKLLLEPETQHGRLIRCLGTAQRVTRIVVNDQDIRQRFGIDHYFQIDVFLPLGDRSIRLGPSDQDGPVFTNSFPATFCVLRLPPELEDLSQRMAAGTLATETLNERVELTAFSFKLWVYKSQYVSSFEQQQRQLAPMLVATSVRMAPLRMGRNFWFELTAGVTFVGVLVLAWIGIWRYNRSDTRFERTTLRRPMRVPPGAALEQLDLPSPAGPDFSQLDSREPPPAP